MPAAVHASKMGSGRALAVLQGHVMDALVSACGWMPLSQSLHLEFLPDCDEIPAVGLNPLAKHLNLQPLLQQDVMPPAVNAAPTVIGVLIAVVTPIVFSNAAAMMIGASRAAVMPVCALSAAVSVIDVLNAAVMMIGFLAAFVTAIGVLDAAVTAIAVSTLP